MNEFPTTFASLRDLERLPWFEGYDDRVIVKHKDVGPIIDVHTHVALAFIRPMAVDLYKEHPHTEHYLGSCCGFDLNPYGNRNFSPDALSTLKKDMSLKSLTAGGMRRTHTVPNLVREMDELGVTQSVLLAIDFPLFSDNSKHAIEASKKTERIIAFGSVHPYGRNVREKLDEQVARGVRGIKIHPAVQQFRPDDPKAMDLYRMCGERNLTVLWHCGPVGIVSHAADFRSQVKFYEKPLAECPKTNFILGHAGALQYEDALALVKKYRNAYPEISSQGLHGVRRMIDGCDPDRVLFGSDWPFYHQAFPLAKVLIATEGKLDLRHKVLHENARKLLRIPS